MASSAFQWPWQHSFPPFYTLQPNLDTQQKQLESWSSLVLTYFESKKQTTVNVNTLISDDCPLFCNKSIKRKVDKDLLFSILDFLKNRGNLKWLNKNKTEARIIWKTDTELADAIAKWAIATGHGNTVCTIYELREGEETGDEIFFGLEEQTIISALKVLEAQNKAVLMGDQEGVKFLLV